MAALNVSANGPSINKSYTSVVNSPAPSGPAASSPAYGQWALFSVSAPLVSAFQGDAGKESTLKVQSTGEGELLDLIEDFSEGRIQFAFVKVKDPNTGLPKYALIGWCGEGVPERTKGYFSSHQAAVAKVLHGYHVQISARSDRDLTPEGIIQKISDASGAKYSGGGNVPSGAAAPPPVAKKPVFGPTSSSTGGGFNPLASRRVAPPSAPVDDDGWGADAPQVTRTQLEKVGSAYQPTKVDMRALTSQSSQNANTSALGNQPGTERPDVVKGAYQPVGKVDIAAIRKQAAQNSSQDDRPTTVKGAYEPVGKVDIAAIRARAQPPGGSSAPVNEAPATALTSDAELGQPKSLADRSAAFSSSGRLADLPKPKVANNFGANSGSFTGTKPLTPGTFGLQGPAPAAGPALGSAGRSFAESSGKSPAQLWAEKKAAQGGAVVPPSAPSAAEPVAAQTSGGWKSGYSGKKWGAVETTKTGASAASLERETTGQDGGGNDAPALNTTTKPSFGGVPMPGLPTRPKADEAPARDLPPPPQVPRTPEPEPEEDEEDTGSPVQVAVPVARGAEVEIPDAHAEQIEPPPPMPTAALAKQASHEQPDDDEPDAGPDPGRQAAESTAAATFGDETTAAAQASSGAGKQAIAEFEYAKDEDNEIDLREGEVITDIDMVDPDWFIGTNSSGARGLFPANYVQLVEDDGAAQGAGTGAPAPAPIPTVNEPAPAAPSAHADEGVTATAQFEYHAAESNELSFEEGDKITHIEFPDEDWWSGRRGNEEGLFPGSYVQLDQ